VDHWADFSGFGLGASLPAHGWRAAQGADTDYSVLEGLTPIGGRFLRMPGPHRSVYMEGPLEWLDGQGVALVRSNDTAGAGPAVRLRRYTQSSHWYYVGQWSNGNANSQYRLDAVVGVHHQSALAKPPAWYWAHFWVSGELTRVRCWPHGAVTPGWQTEGETAPDRRTTDPGRLGIASGGSSGNGTTDVAWWGWTADLGDLEWVDGLPRVRSRSRLLHLGGS
jgi:hypothetical protein